MNPGTQETCIIGACAFASAFLGCVQAINITRGHRVSAAMTSCAIGASQLTVLKLVPAVTGLTPAVVFILAGVAGAQCSMIVKNWRR